jgi:hypothetical protein
LLSHIYSFLIDCLQIGALIGHCVFFWGKDVVGSVKRSFKGQHDDRHHAAMVKYKEAPWYWYLGTLIIAFVFGLVAVLKENISLPAWAYVVSLLLGMIIAPFVRCHLLWEKHETDLPVRVPCCSHASEMALRPTRL